MSKVLVINGSMIDPEVSVSKKLLDTFIKEYKALNPNDELIMMDLNDETAGTISLNKHNMKDFFNENDSLKYIKQLKGVDKVIMTSPMTNFNTSALVKNYMDHICLANETFSYKYSKKGDAIGLLDHLKVQILTTQGAPYGWYLWGNHTSYLKGTWEFLGATVVEPILLSGTKTAPFNQMKPNEVVATMTKEIQVAAKAF